MRKLRSKRRKKSINVTVNVKENARRQLRQRKPPESIKLPRLAFKIPHQL
jgi:hypothetical protein